MGFAMVRKAVINGAPEGGCYSSHSMYGSGSLREDNVERSILRCAALRSKLGVESITQKINAFHAILEATPVVESRAECRWRREECGCMKGLEFEALQKKIIAK